MVDFRIAQITDLHIGDENEFPFGVDLRTNLISALEDIEKLDVDLLVLTGDLCLDQPQMEHYEWIRRQLQRLDIPYEVIGGNHDDISQMTLAMMEEDLSTEEGEYYFSDIIHDHAVLYLDSAKGCLSDVQLDWVRSQIDHVKQKSLIIFIHHPPVKSGVPHMDRKYPLTNGDELMNILFEYEGYIQIFTGHYHVDRCVVASNVSINITPSLFMQLSAFEEGYSIDHYRIGYRIIDLTGEEIRHTVRYLPGNRF